MKSMLLNKWLVISLLLSFVFCSCTQSTSFSEEKSQSVGLKYPAGASQEIAASWPHALLLYENGAFATMQKATNASQLLPFELTSGYNYGMAAVAASSFDALSWKREPQKGDLLSDHQLIVDYTQEIPEFLLGYTAVKKLNASLPITLHRMVAKLQVCISDVPQEVTAVEITVGNLYDQVSLEGQYGVIKEGEMAVKTMSLTREGTTFATEKGEMILPSDSNATTLALTYRITRENGSVETYTSQPVGKIKANKEVLLVVDGTDLNSTVLSTTIQYASWDGSIEVEDTIEVDSSHNYLKNSQYEVSIQTASGDWKNLSVYPALVSNLNIRNSNNADFTGAKRDTMAFTRFSDLFNAPVKVRVEKKQGGFSSVQIRPLSYNISYTQIDSKTIEFTLQNAAQKVSVEFDGDRQHNLFVFPDLPDTDLPDKNSSNVLYYEAGEHTVGRINLKTGQTLYLAEGAVVYGDVRAENASNITIRGRGILCSSKEDHGKDTRSQQMNIVNCTHVTIKDIIMRDSPHWSLRLERCTNVSINNIKQISWMLNSDGIDVCNSSYVDIRDCFLRNYDDNITCKNFGWFWRNTEHILAENNVFWADAAHCMLVGPEGGAANGSTYRTLSDIVFRNNIVLENRENYSIYTGAMGIMAANKGTFKDIVFENIIVEDIRGGRVLSVDYTNYEGYGEAVSNILFKNITYTGTQALSPSRVRGYSKTYNVDGITLDNVLFNGTRITSDTQSLLQTNSYVYNITYR